MITRIISGIIFVAIVIVGIMAGSFTSLAYLGVFGAITALCIYEFLRLIKQSLHCRINLWLNIAAGLYFFVAGYLYFSGRSNALAFLPWFIFFLLLCIEDIFKNPQENMHSIAYSFFAQVYISLPMMLLSGIAFQEKDGAICYLPELLLFLYAFIWISDSFAYLTGITLGRIGKHPFMSRISPKKTWEGFVGGLAFTVLAGYLVSLFFPEIMNTWEWMGLALVIALTGVTGDLFASLIKRCMGVKDFGKIMPGHGGMLDRIDSSLFAIPASVIYCYFIF